jgi:hypothetical protein
MKEGTTAILQPSQFEIFYLDFSQFNSNADVVAGMTKAVS